MQMLGVGLFGRFWKQLDVQYLPFPMCNPFPVGPENPRQQRVRLQRSPRDSVWTTALASPPKSAVQRPALRELHRNGGGAGTAP